MNSRWHATSFSLIRQEQVPVWGALSCKLKFLIRHMRSFSWIEIHGTGIFLQFFLFVQKTSQCYLYSLLNISFQLRTARFYAPSKEYTNCTKSYLKDLAERTFKRARKWVWQSTRSPCRCWYLKQQYLAHPSTLRSRISKHFINIKSCNTPVKQVVIPIYSSGK